MGVRERRASIVGIALAAFATLTGSARADTVNGAIGPIRDTRHVATVTLRPGHAEWAAKRTLETNTDEANQAVIDIQLPIVAEDFFPVGTAGAPISLSLQLDDVRWR